MEMTPHIFNIMRKIAPGTPSTKAEFTAWLEQVSVSTDWPDGVSEIEFKNAKIHALKMKQKIEGA